MPYDENCALFYAKTRSFLKNSGQLIGGNDLFIASHALSCKAILVTNNSSEFKKVPGLKIEDWNVNF